MRYQGGGRRSEQWLVEIMVSTFHTGNRRHHKEAFKTEADARDYYVSCETGDGVSVRLWRGVDCVQTKGE